MDGDGIVGPREYVIAKRFDEDKDGKLNEQERKNAIQALKNGVEDEYKWNIEQAGSKRNHRIIQKRGVIVDAEDYSQMLDTYPEHPITHIKPNATTRGNALQGHARWTIRCT